MMDIVDIVETEIANKMDLSLRVVDSANNNVQVCQTKWAREEKGLFGSDDQPYIIESVNQSSKVISLVDPFESPDDVVYLERPFYKHGTPMVVNGEWESNELAILPCIWLLEPVNERPFGRESSVERESDLRVLFIDDRNPVSWLNDDIHARRSVQLYNMAMEFIDTINRNPIFKRFESYSIRNLTKLGRETEEGFVRSIIDSDLTALELRLTLPIYKRSDCEC